MRYRKKRLLIGLLSSAIFLTGCGGIGNFDTQTGQAKERFLISIMLEDFYGSPVSGAYADEVMEKLEEYTECDIDFMWVSADNYTEKVNNMLAQGSGLPMLMQVEMSAGVLTAAEKGMLWDLTEFLEDEESLPNLSQANENINKSFTVGGQLIGIYRGRMIGRYGWGYRQDWAEALGLGEPRTVDDLYEMLYQFTYGDPDGNGKNDTYGLCLSRYTGSLDVMQTWFGCGNGWTEKDGNLVPVHQTAEYKNALDWFRKIYAQGLVYPDFAVRDVATWRNGMYDGECGVYVDMIGDARGIWDRFVNNHIPAVTGNGYASMKLMIGLSESEDIEIRTLASPGHSGCFVITKAARTKEDVMKCLQFLDKLNDYDMLMLINYGLENIHWEKRGEYIVDLDAAGGDSANAYRGLNQLGNIKGGYIDYELRVQYEERKALELELDLEAEKYVVYNPADGYLTNSQAYSVNGLMLDSILENARLQYIVGQIGEDGLEAAWQNWLDRGGRDVIDEVNRQYHEDLFGING